MKKKRFRSDIYNIFQKPYLTRIQKYRLFFAYLKLRSIRFLPKIGLCAKCQKVRVLGIQFQFSDFLDFYWTFKDNFIDEGYYFSSDVVGPHILDCGANIGVTSLYFKFLYPKAKITAFEPEPSNIKYLKKNITANGFEDDITIVEKALAQKEKTVEIHGVGRAVTILKELHTMEVTSKEHYNAEEMTTVQAVKLSPFVTQDVSAIKLDIEGAEVEVLQELDAAKVLSGVTDIVLEYHKYNSADTSFSEVVASLEKNDYAIMCLYGEHTLEKLAAKDYYHIMLNAKK